MGHWNYRVVVMPHREMPAFYIREVHYDDDGKIDSWNESHTSPLGSSTKELKGDLEYINLAFKRPYLIENDDMLHKLNGLLIWDITKAK